jgi:hypothetical protein
VIAGLVQGCLFRAPEQCTAKSGKTFVSATIRVKDGDESRFVRVVAISETAQTELLRLADGDSLWVQGPLTASI